MGGNRAKFRRKKEQAIAALLFHKNQEAAARAVGIGVTTLQRWLKDPEFQAAYQKARRTVFRESITRLQEASGAAVTTVLKIMLDSKVSPGTRLRAAELVLSRVMAMEDLAAELERTAPAPRGRKTTAIFALVERPKLAGPTATPAQISAAPQGDEQHCTRGWPHDAPAAENENDPENQPPNCSQFRQTSPKTMPKTAQKTQKP